MYRPEHGCSATMSAMWQPEPGWQRLPGSGPSTVGVWLAVEQGRPVVVKRLQAPAEHDPGDLSRPGNPAWWRRAADVALDGCVADSSGLRSPAVVRVEEDSEGVTLVHEHVLDAHNSGLFRARALGRFAGEALPERGWLAEDLLRSRLAQVGHRGGWKLLARTTVADVADHLWTRRESYLAQLDSLPLVPQHGDPTAGNLVGRTGDGTDVVAIDWGTLGAAPVGTDLGYFSLGAREEFEPLLVAHLDGMPAGVASPAQVVLGARITAVYTALTRADWALARVAGGAGALAGKFRHPAVAPHLRVLQRQFAHFEALLG